MTKTAPTKARVASAVLLDAAGATAWGLLSEPSGADVPGVLKTG